MKFVEIEKIEKGEIKNIYHLKIKKNHNFFANKLCVHNCDYTGEVCVLLVNLSDKPFTINNGDRIAQMIINKYEKCEWDLVDELNKTDRGEGGFSSTGIK